MTLSQNAEIGDLLIVSPNVPMSLLVTKNNRTSTAIYNTRRQVNLQSVINATRESNYFRGDPLNPAAR